MLGPVGHPFRYYCREFRSVCHWDSQSEYLLGGALSDCNASASAEGLLNRPVTIRDRSAILGDAPPCNLYRILHAVRRESRHCRRRIRLENDLSTPLRPPTRGIRPGIHCCIRVHNRPDSHRDHGLER
jgi:hypothetical protein